jgi:hypothetical protein
MGASPYQVSVSLGTANQTFLTDEFLLSFINYAISVYGNMSQAKTPSDLVDAFNAASPAAVQYLLTNSQNIKEVMMNSAIVREGQIGE